MSRWFLAASVFGLVALAACTAAPEDVAGTPGEQRVQSLGILAVERASGDGSGTAPASLGAAFARYQGVDRASVERFLGAGEETGADACALRANDADALVATDASVELVDVGAISVTAGESETRMPPRAFPEIARVAGGFFYADDAVVPAVTTEGGEYTFRAEGSAEEPAFEVVAPGPPDVADLRVDGAMPNAVVRAQGTAVTWTPGDPRDQVEIEVQTTGGTLVCRARDDGEFAVPASALAAVGADADARLVVRRVRTTPFDAPGIEVAYVRIATSRQFSLDVR